MSVYDPAAVRAGIKSILTGITSLQSVYDFPNPNISGYPSAIFEMDNEDGSMLDDVNNQRVLTFKIWVACEVPVKGLSNAVALLDSITKDVINALEKQTNATLGGSADWTMPVIGARSQSMSPEGTFLTQELNLKVYIASTIL